MTTATGLSWQALPTARAAFGAPAAGRTCADGGALPFDLLQHAIDPPAHQGIIARDLGRGVLRVQRILHGPIAVAKAHGGDAALGRGRSEEHTSELQSQSN